MKLFRRSLILAHRYLGIAIGLLVVMWFASGIVMMYAGEMPRLTPQRRLERLSNLDLARVRLSPTEAADRARSGDPSSSTPNTGTARTANGPRRVQLLTVLERPAYRVDNATVFADTGERLEVVTPAVAQTIASRFMGIDVSRVHFVRTLDRVDQWTIGQGRAMPLHKFRVDDDLGTEVYVQPATAEVSVLTTRRGRALAWIGTIPHWLYFTALRENQPLWYQIVVWTSAAACVLAVFGLVLGVTQFRKTRPFRLSHAIPYRGFMRWHYITGVVFGLFTLTWAFSGLLSMEPFAWTNATGLEIGRNVLTGGPLDLAAFPVQSPETWTRVLQGRAIKELEFSRIQGDPYYVVRQAPNDPVDAKRRERLHQPYLVTGRTEADRVLVDAKTFELRRTPFTDASLVTRLRQAVPEAPIVETALLADYDSYYYSRGRQTPLPVLRVKFADPAETWVYIDPEMSQVLATVHRLNRVERWLYNGFHSLDFRFWYDRRPLWDIGMIVLLLGGLTTSALGLLMGVKRLVRVRETYRGPAAHQRDR